MMTKNTYAIAPITLVLGLFWACGANAVIPADQKCLLGLADVPTDSVSIGSDSKINAVCDMHSNGNFLINGNAAITGAGIISAVDQVNILGSASVASTFTILENAPQEADPLALLPSPPTSPCTFNDVVINNKTDVVLLPGVYCNGLSIINSQVTLAPGNYVIRNGDFKIRGGTKTNVTGTEVFIYLGRNDASESVGNISFVFQGTLDLRAPASGPFADILIFQDRNAVNANDKSNISENEISVAHLTLAGIVYTPARSLGVSRTTDLNASVPMCVSLIAKQIEISGKVSLAISCI